MLDQKTREYLLKQSPASLVEIIEGYAMKLESAHRRLKRARYLMKRVFTGHVVRDILDLRKRKDLDR